MDDSVILYIGILIIFGLIAGRMTYVRRGNFWLGFLLGFFLTALGIIIAHFLPVDKKNNHIDYRPHIRIDENWNIYVEHFYGAEVYRGNIKDSKVVNELKQEFDITFSDLENRVSGRYNYRDDE